MVNKIKLPILVFLLSFSLLAIVQLKVENPMILLERFIKDAGWIEILFLSIYGSFLISRMMDPQTLPGWRKLSWVIFSVVFFSQLAIGLAGGEKFLMTGKLHLPIPMMIIGGPVFRGEISFMTILFLSTVILSGPAWCSQLCYFGAFDYVAAGGRTTKKILRHKGVIKSTIIIIVVIAALIMRWMNLPVLTTTIIAGGFGIAGLLVILLLSLRRKKMVHCVMYCPVGTLVNLFKYVNPARMYIDQSCTLCMHCTRYCKYDALNPEDIKRGKPGITCTLCGDCLAGCQHNSINYRYFRLSPEISRNIWLVLTVTLHTVFLGLARL